MPPHLFLKTAPIFLSAISHDILFYLIATLLPLSAKNPLQSVNTLLRFDSGKFPNAANTTITLIEDGVEHDMGIEKAQMEAKYRKTGKANGKERKCGDFQREV